MNLTAWAIKWGVPQAALEDLQLQMGVYPIWAGTEAQAEQSEAAISAVARLEATRRGMRLWRNNVGAGKLEDGSFLRWGLANDSQQLNAVMKSSDLIGIGPGGRFIAREVKPGGWHYTGTPREVAQRAFIELILSYGGDAAFASGKGTL